jgi:uncharacterized membrane protein YfcA
MQAVQQTPGLVSAQQQRQNPRASAAGYSMASTGSSNKYSGIALSRWMRVHWHEVGASLLGSIFLGLVLFFWGYSKDYKWMQLMGVLLLLPALTLCVVAIIKEMLHYA